MTAATKPDAKATAYDDAIRTLNNAAYQLSQAASAADTAIDRMEDLAELAQQLHEREHNGPIRWCTYELCRKADAVLETIRTTEGHAR